MGSAAASRCVQFRPAWCCAVERSRSRPSPHAAPNELRRLLRLGKLLLGSLCTRLGLDDLLARVYVRCAAHRAGLCAHSLQALPASPHVRAICHADGDVGTKTCAQCIKSGRQPSRPRTVEHAKRRGREMHTSSPPASSALAVRRRCRFPDFRGRFIAAHAWCTVHVREASDGRSAGRMAESHTWHRRAPRKTRRRGAQRAVTTKLTMKPGRLTKK